MNLIDTHCHLFLPEFDHDRDEMIRRALDSGVIRFVLPHVDSNTTEGLLELARKYPGQCLPLMGLHPTSVNAEFENELKHAEYLLNSGRFYGIGEIGIDLYWDQSFLLQQQEAFHIQLEWAHRMNLPAIIHVRNSYQETLAGIRKAGLPGLTGIFHCFSGTEEEAREISEMGFLLGIGGVVTFKNSNLDKVLRNIDLSKIVLETDSPYLAPVPYRGKRNEPAYLVHVVSKLAEIYGTSPDHIAEQTTRNSGRLFNFD